MPNDSCDRPSCFLLSLRLAARRLGDRPALIVLTLFSFALRLIHINQESLWIDEILTIRAAEGNVLRFVWEAESNPPFSFILFKLWGAIFGLGAIPMRLFAALLASLCVPSLWLCARRWGLGRAAAFGLALALALNPMHYWYSQQVRYYPVLSLLGVLWLAELPRLALPGRLRVNPLFALTGILCFLTHYYFAFLFIAAAAGLLAWSVFNRAALPRILLNFFVLGCLMLAFLPLFLHQLGNPSPMLWAAIPKWSEFASVFHQFYWTGPRVKPRGWQHAAALFTLAAALAGYAWTAARRRRQSPAGGAAPATPCAPALSPFNPLAAGALLLWIALFSVFQPFIISRLAKPVFNADRYTFVFLPAFMLAVAIGLAFWHAPRPGARRWPAAVPWLALALYAAMAWRSLGFYWSKPQEVRWREAVARVNSAWLPGDAIVFSPDWARQCFEYNNAIPGFAHKIRDRALPSADLASMLKARRLWLVCPDESSHISPGYQSLASQLSHYPNKQEFKHRNASVTLFVISAARPAPAAPFNAPPPSAAPRPSPAGG